ncbi:MAG: hypothetical protein ACJ72N_07495 [Labedaea sp.]
MSHHLTRAELRDHTFTTYLASAPVAAGGRKRLIGTASLADGRVTFKVEVGGVTTLETGDWHAAMEAYNAAGQDPEKISSKTLDVSLGQ